MINCGDQKEQEPVSSSVDPLTLLKNGEYIYKTNCVMCHVIKSEEATGKAPALDSAIYHWPDEKKLRSYIKNAKEMLNTDDYSTQLYERYKGQLQMPPYPGLTDEDMDGVIAFLKSIQKQ